MGKDSVSLQEWILEVLVPLFEKGIPTPFPHLPPYILGVEITFIEESEVKR
jgi:hypothetical protein